MKSPASEYTVTVIDYGDPDHGDYQLTKKEYKTIAVSVKQAVNNVAHRLGVHFCVDRPYYDTGLRLLHAAVVECEGRTVMLF